MISSQFKNKDITIIENIPDLTIDGFENECLQVIINILNNSRETLLSNKKGEKYIFIDVYKEDGDIIINIKDNVNGIEEDIIEKHMNREIKVSNEFYKYKEKDYVRAQFKIYLPTNSTE